MAARRLRTFAMKPDLCFLLDVPVEVALQRILVERPVKYYEAGMDVVLDYPDADPNQCFRDFQGSRGWAISITRFKWIARQWGRLASMSSMESYPLKNSRTPFAG